MGALGNHVSAKFQRKTSTALLISSFLFLADFREFICSLSVTTRGTLDEKLRWAFSIYDIDGNGYITVSEIISIIQSIQKMVGALDDSNTSEERVVEVFTMFDTNNDGKLSMEEFLAGAKKDKIFMKMLQNYA